MEQDSIDILRKDSGDQIKDIDNQFGVISEEPLEEEGGEVDPAFNLSQSAILAQDSFSARPSQGMYFGIVDEVNHYGFADGDNLFDENDSLLGGMNPEEQLNPINFTQ